MRLIKIIFCLLLTSACDAQSATVPDFNFLRMDNSQLFTQKEMASGKASLFIFFDVTCSHCQEAIKSFNSHYKKLKMIPVYLVTRDDKTAAAQFLSSYGKNLYGLKNVTLLHDRYDEFISKFKPVKYPSIFLYSTKQQLLKYSNEPKDIAKFLEVIKSMKK